MEHPLKNGEIHPKLIENNKEIAKGVQKKIRQRAKATTDFRFCPYFLKDSESNKKYWARTSSGILLWQSQKEII